MNNTTTKLCEACGKKVHGRNDKKFCNDYCRNFYHNQQRLPESYTVKYIIATLKKNRDILRLTLANEEMLKTTKARLTDRGFNFQYITHLYENKKGNIYYFCFEYGYLPLDHDWYLIVKRQSDKTN